MNPILPKNIMKYSIFIRTLKLLSIYHPPPQKKNSAPTQQPNTKKIAKEFISSHALTYDYVVVMMIIGRYMHTHTFFGPWRLTR